MQDKTYNGYTNYETWAVCLWIGNEQGNYEYVQELVREAGNIYRAADRLQELYEEAKDDILENAKLTSSVWADLWGHTLRRINWQEVAEAHKPDEWGDSDSAPEEEE